MTKLEILEFINDADLQTKYAILWQILVNTPIMFFDFDTKTLSEAATCSMNGRCLQLNSEIIKP
jgi:hypothetical protein